MEIFKEKLTYKNKDFYSLRNFIRFVLECKENKEIIPINNFCPQTTSGEYFVTSVKAPFKYHPEIDTIEITLYGDKMQRKNLKEFLDTSEEMYNEQLFKHDNAR